MAIDGAAQSTPPSGRFTPRTGRVTIPLNPHSTTINNNINKIPICRIEFRNSWKKSIRLHTLLPHFSILMVMKDNKRYNEFPKHLEPLEVSSVWIRKLHYCPNTQLLLLKTNHTFRQCKPASEPRFCLHPVVTTVQRKCDHKYLILFTLGVIFVMCRQWRITWAVKSTLKPSKINRSRPASDCVPTLSGSYYYDFPHLNEFETAKLSRLTENGFQSKTIWCSLRISQALGLVRSGNFYMVVINGNILLHVALKYSQRSDDNAHHLLQC